MYFAFILADILIFICILFLWIGGVLSQPFIKRMCDMDIFIKDSYNFIFIISLYFIQIYYLRNSLFGKKYLLYIIIAYISSKFLQVLLEDIFIRIS